MSNHPPPPTKGQVFQNILGGIAALIALTLVLGATFGVGFLTAQRNADKVEHMNQLCVARGYSGWTDDRGGSRCTR
jgi:hypothetical protein